MLSIHNNFMASHAARNLRINTKDQMSVMEKLSSGYKINKASDDPAGLIQSEKLRAQIDGLERAIQNSTESDNVLGIMEGALGEVQNVLRKMKALAIESANSGVISQDTIAANQAEMDSALQAIDRILGVTNYGGRKLLDNMRTQGKIGDNYESLLNAAQVEREGGDKLSNLIDKNQITEDGKLFLTAPNQDHKAQVDEDGKLINGDKTFVLYGLGDDPDESVVLEFAEGTHLDDVLAKLREHAEALPDAMKTGSKAIPTDGRNGTNINTIELEAEVLAGFASLSDDLATGYLAEYMQNFTREIEVDYIGWEKLNEYDKQLLQAADSLSNLTTGGLGSVAVEKGTDENGNPIYEYLTLDDLYSGGAASLSEDPVAAMKVVDAAIKGVAAERANIGAIRAMSVHERSAMEAAVENLTRSESALRDTDFAEATIEFARTQVLSQVGMNILQAAQQQNEFILNLLA